LMAPLLPKINTQGFAAGRPSRTQAWRKRLKTLAARTDSECANV
jgi:hypothetical protein